MLKVTPEQKAAYERFTPPADRPLSPRCINIIREQVLSRSSFKPTFRNRLCIYSSFRAMKYHWAWQRQYPDVFSKVELDGAAE